MFIVPTFDTINNKFIVETAGILEGSVAKERTVQAKSGNNTVSM